MNIHERYMQRCLQLARMADGNTSPNPMVGAVVVCDGRIIGEGYHRRCGEAHAEVNAIASVRDKSLLSQSTIYVSLEPCSHHGKTPPCCDLIISSGIPHVVVGCLDPFPQVSGRGVECLRKNNVKVTVNVLQEECLWLNRKFMTYQQKQRPYITLKWAQSCDGYIDRNRQPNENATIFSTPTTRSWSHRLRATHDAIIVGTNTILTDNPSLTTRYWHGKNPLRITIDRHHRIPEHYTICDGSTPTLLINGNCSHDNIESITLNTADITPQDIAHTLFLRNIQSLIVEGGRELLQSFIDADLWDEARIEVAPTQLHSGIEAPCIKGTIWQTIRHNTAHHTHILVNR
ncbi:MAG: bifunctional diaminohydroxyphosphoribosylaminopyrimidine deaminase/5-amino-6-(5-phosphoribosylamino)uracil reductase RibD [Bacteroidaceae bacterium]|nr:bifunctional diaminohydroxyphosphoribosylaminopyrimidine deaminase/5-amino-6-(5-phosphoribosylamino)uracil reductase RibD [Bacteroidaceae bacterium]